MLDGADPAGDSGVAVALDGGGGWRRAGAGARVWARARGFTGFITGFGRHRCRAMKAGSGGRSRGGWRAFGALADSRVGDTAVGRWIVGRIGGVAGRAVLALQPVQAQAHAGGLAPAAGAVADDDAGGQQRAARPLHIAGGQGAEPRHRLHPGPGQQQAQCLEHLAVDALQHHQGDQLVARIQRRAGQDGAAEAADGLAKGGLRFGGGGCGGGRGRWREHGGTSPAARWPAGGNAAPCGRTSPWLQGTADFNPDF